MNTVEVPRDLHPAQDLVPEGGRMNTWEFTVQRAGSRRVDHWPDPKIPPVWLDPVKRDLNTAADVERYIDATWPAP